MRSVTTCRALIFASIIGVAASPISAFAAIGDKFVDRIVGQANGTTNLPNSGGLNASALNKPTATAFDAAGNMYIADFGNHRVLGYRSPYTTDLVADVVIGHPDFNSDIENSGGVSASSLGNPREVTVDSNGNLWVADVNNHRVLEYDRPFETDSVADFVLGQESFTSTDHIPDRADASSLYYPTDIAVDKNGNVWVGDSGNYRVLGYNQPLATRDRIADRVVGQANFTDHTYERTALDKQFYPAGIALDTHGNLWVVDSPWNRVLEFEDPSRFDATADRLIGQPSYDGFQANYSGSTDASGLNQPSGIFVDVNGNVYVSDSGNNRVLMYVSPEATNDRVADQVYGQPDLTSFLANNGGVSAQTANYPFDVGVDPNGNVAYTDYFNSRVALVDSPTPLVTSVQVKVARATGKPKLIVRVVGVNPNNSILEVNGTPLATTKFKSVAADGNARRLIGTDAELDIRIPRGTPVLVTVFDQSTGSRSAPIPFTR